MEETEKINSYTELVSLKRSKYPRKLQEKVVRRRKAQKIKKHTSPKGRKR